MRKCKRLLVAFSATALMSALLAGTAMAAPMYQLYDVEWQDDDHAIATWDDDDCDYDHYQVKLVRDGDDYSDEVTVSSKHHNFEGDITRTGSYTFKVRVRFGSDDEGEWYESDELDVDEDMLSEWHGGYHHHDDDDDDDDNIGEPGSISPGPSGSYGPGAVSSGYGWVQNGGTWYYRNTDGSLDANGWDYIDGHWYYFNSSGVMETGWIHDTNDGHWYYCVLSNNPYGLPEGAMLESNYTPDGYYVNSSGVWQ